MKKKDKDELRGKMKGSSELLARAKKVLLSHYAVSSWGGTSDIPFVESSHGSRVTDVDGNEYIDMCMSYGALILGHGHPVIKETVREIMEHGTVHGFGHKYEVELAELLVDAVKFGEMAAFTNSGTEATMHALKVARAYTRKDKIAKFEGCYHGTHDYIQISGRGAVAGPIEKPGSLPLAGIPAHTVEQVIVLSVNQQETFDIIRKNKADLAAVIIEPVPTCCPIDFKDFLQELREVTTECKVVLIFDEVLNGFRYNYGSIANVYGIDPDLSTFGKVIGGGFPAGAIVGNRKMLSPLISSGNIVTDIKTKPFIVGTFNGNPATCGAGAATLKFLKNNPLKYQDMLSLSGKLRQEMEAIAKHIGFPFQTLGIGSWFMPYFVDGEVKKPRDVKWNKTNLIYGAFGKHMCKNGVLVGDVPLLFLSTSHTEEDINLVLKAFEKSLQEMY